MNMAADKAEDPPELLETLAENRITFEKQIGCLAGLLQIFHCQCTLNGHRKTSNRLRPVHGKAIATYKGSPMYLSQFCRAEYMHYESSTSIL